MLLITGGRRLDERIALYDRYLAQMAREDTRAQQLMRLSGIGETTATALLVLGARAVLNSAKNKTDAISRWAVAQAERRGYWRAIVAIAAKNARLCWAMLHRGGSFAMPA